MRAGSAGIHVQELGHVTLFVSDVEAAARFYRDALGLIDRGRGKNGRIAFFSADRHHHDLACQAVGPDAPAPGAPGLYHVAFRIGRTGAALEAARRALEARGLPVFGEWRTGHGRSISTRDPDGHEIELYVDLPRKPAASPAGSRARAVARVEPAREALRFGRGGQPATTRHRARLRIRRKTT